MWLHKNCQTSMTSLSDKLKAANKDEFLSNHHDDHRMIIVFQTQLHVVFSLTKGSD